MVTMYEGTGSCDKSDVRLQHHGHGGTPEAGTAAVDAMADVLWQGWSYRTTVPGRAITTRNGDDAGRRRRSAQRWTRWRRWRRTCRTTLTCRMELYRSSTWLIDLRIRYIDVGITRRTSGTTSQGMRSGLASMFGKGWHIAR